MIALLAGGVASADDAGPPPQAPAADEDEEVGSDGGMELPSAPADRSRRDAWLAQRLRELTPGERALLREAAPLIQRLATAS